MKRMESADSSWAKSRENPPPVPPPGPAPGQPSYIVVVEAENRLGVSNLSEDVSPSYCKSIERSIEEKKKKPGPERDNGRLQTQAGGAWNPEVDRKLEYLFSKNTYTLRNERSVIKTKFNLDEYPSTRTIDMQGSGKIKDVLKVTKLEDMTNTELFCNVKYIKAMIYLYSLFTQEELLQQDGQQVHQLHLAARVRVHRCQHTLVLFASLSTDTKPEGVVQICRNLINLGNLASLNLEFYQDLPSEAIRKISESLEVLLRLKKLSLNTSKLKSMSDADCLNLIRPISRIKLLMVKLDFSGSGLEDFCIESLVEALKSCSELMRCELRFRE